MTCSSLEPLARVRTKIVATLGPRSRDQSTIRQLIEAGVDVFRLNFSHATHAVHSENLERIRAASHACQKHVAVLQDLGGPKIRLGAIPGDIVDCGIGDVFTLVRERSSDDPHQLTCTYEDLCADLKLNDVVLFADGLVMMRVEEASPVHARLVVTLAGRLRSNQGLNLPGADLKVSALTERDLRDLDWTSAHEVDYVGLSFVRTADDVKWLRQELRARESTARIVAKIEKPQAVTNLDAIIAETDAVMVARGDLGVELDVARVPAIQKRILAACHRARVPVITATQMLTSMESSSRPTRAEASDVFNAVLDGTDAVMLSGETAIGEYPIEAVSTMSRIAGEAEAFLAGARPDPGPLERVGWITPTTEVVVKAAALACTRLNAALAVVATHSGRTALALSKQRYSTPTIALADSPGLVRAMCLYWGVSPLLLEKLSDGATALSFALDWAKQRGLVHAGDRVVLVRGTVPGNPVHNAVLVQEVE